MIWIFLISAANLAAFLAMGYDKLQAKRHKKRIPENSLMLMAFLLGAPGIYLGMSVFRHKSKKALFRYGVPLLMIWNVFLFWLFCYEVHI